MDRFFAIQRSFCLETEDIFNASLETKYDLFEYTTSMYRCSKHIIRFNPSLYCPITDGFGKDSGGHSIITDLLQQAAKSVGNCALVSNGGCGSRFPINFTDTDVLSEQPVLKCSNSRKYLSEQGENSSTLNQMRNWY